MHSNKDLERFYFQYQAEAVPHGVSLQSFCLQNNVPYNPFWCLIKRICSKLSINLKADKSWQSLATYRSAYIKYLFFALLLLPYNLKWWENGL